MRSTTHDPKESVLVVRYNSPAVVVGQSDDPISTSDIQSLNKLDLKLGISRVLRDGLSNTFDPFTVPETFVVNFNAFSVRVRSISGLSLSASSLEIVRDDSLFVPSSNIFIWVNIVNSFRRIHCEMTSTEGRKGDHCTSCKSDNSYGLNSFLT